MKTEAFELRMRRKELLLTEEDKRTLLEGAMLNDKHKNGCGLLVSKQSPELPKPQSPLYAQNIFKIQTVHTGSYPTLGREMFKCTIPLMVKHSDLW